MLKRTEVSAVKETYQGSSLVILASFLRLPEGNCCGKFPNGVTDFSQNLNMLAIQSNIAKYHCLYTQGAVAFQTPGIFDSPGSKEVKMYNAFLKKFDYISPFQIRVKIKTCQKTRKTDEYF